MYMSIVSYQTCVLFNIVTYFVQRYRDFALFDNTWFVECIEKEGDNFSKF